MTTRARAQRAVTVLLLVASLVLGATSASGAQEHRGGSDDRRLLHERKPSSGRGLHAGARSPRPATPEAADQASVVKDSLSLQRRLDGGDAAVRLIALLDETAAAGDVAALARAGGARLRHHGADLPYVSFEVPAGKLRALRGDLSAVDGVADVVPAVRRHLTRAPNDPEYAARQRAYLELVRAPEAWGLARSSADVVIAVIDTGIDAAHPDLAGKVVGTYNVVTGASTAEDVDGHGTFVAGVAAAETDNGVGVAGAGFNAAVLAVKVDRADGSIWDDDVAAGIRYAADQGAEVINLSLGSSQPSSVERSAIDYAVDRGVLVVAAAGNESTSSPHYPAAYPGVLAVGATDGSSRATFSNYGSWVDVAAPGVGVYSTSPRAGSTLPANYAAGDGTSFSAPLVAGQAALLLGHRPSAATTQVSAAITESASGFAGLGLGSGRVDFRTALDAFPPSSIPVIVAPADGSTIAGNLSVAATSDADQVEFRLRGTGVGKRVTADGTTAATTLETFGLANGGHGVQARSCNGHGCGPWSQLVTLTVANDAPVITAPAAGQTVSGAMTLRATAPGGGVRFLVDGRAAGFDGSAPYTVPYTTGTLRDGSHSVSARACNRAGTRCDGPTSGAHAFEVLALHPQAIRATSPFSPNGDGRRDSSVLVFRLPESQRVRWRVLDSSGRLVYGPRSTGRRDLAAGRHRVTWTGRTNAGRRVREGRYVIQILTSKATADGTLHGAAQRTVQTDVTAPRLGTVTGRAATLYPVRDRYRDTIAPVIALRDPARRTWLVVRDRRGSAVRTVAGGRRGVGRFGLAWNGRSASGRLVPEGRYTYAFRVEDGAGNRRESRRYRVTVSHKRLVTRTATRTVTPMASLHQWLIGECSAFATPARDDWPGSVYLLSDYYGIVGDCPITSDAYDVAASIHRMVLPRAIAYKRVRVSAFGMTDWPGDTGALFYVDRGGELTGAGTVMGSNTGWYAGPRVAAGDFVRGRTMEWLVGTDDTSWYAVRTFRVTVTYTALD